MPVSGRLKIASDVQNGRALDGLKAGALEIHPGQSKQLALMRRVAPNFINRQLWKTSKKFVPVGPG